MTSSSRTVEHTAGPWEAGPSGYNMTQNYSQPFGILHLDSSTLICGCFGDVPGGKAVAKANAEFITRACNSHEGLLAMLDEARLQIEYLESKFQPTGTSAAVIARIRTAIAAAKGGAA